MRLPSANNGCSNSSQSCAFFLFWESRGKSWEKGEFWWIFCHICLGDGLSWLLHACFLSWDIHTWWITYAHIHVQAHLHTHNTLQEDMKTVCNQQTPPGSCITCICVYIYIYVCIHAYIYAYIYIYICIYFASHVFPNQNICRITNAKHTQRHTYIHTYIYMSNDSDD